MNEVSQKEGRTVLFVSHNMAAINQLCNKAICLRNGQIHEQGQTGKIVSNYLNAGGTTEAHVKLNGIRPNRIGNRKVEFTEITLKKSSLSLPIRVFSIGESIHINFTLKFNNPNERLIKSSIVLKTSDGLKIANMVDVDSGFQMVFENEKLVSYEVVLEDVRLYPDTYYISLWAGDGSGTEYYDYVEDCISFEIIEGGKLTSRWLPKAAGLLFLTPYWKKLV